MTLLWIYLGGLIAYGGCLLHFAPPQDKPDLLMWAAFSLTWPVTLTYILMEHYLWGNSE